MTCSDWSTSDNVFCPLVSEKDHHSTIWCTSIPSACSTLGVACRLLCRCAHTNAAEGSQGTKFNGCPRRLRRSVRDAQGAQDLVTATACTRPRTSRTHLRSTPLRRSHRRRWRWVDCAASSFMFGIPPVESSSRWAMLQRTCWRTNKTASGDALTAVLRDWSCKSILHSGKTAMPRVLCRLVSRMIFT